MKKGLFDFLGLRDGDGPQQCETSYDCESPLVCCDLLIAKVCCGGGMMIPRARGVPEMELQRRAIPIPVEKDNGFPPGFRGPGQPRNGM